MEAPLRNGTKVPPGGACIVVLLVLIGAGHTWGLGTWWNKLDIVRRYPILR